MPLLLLQFIACTQVKELNGIYANGGAEYRFDQVTKKFEYTSRGEMGILAYSSGSWVIKNNKVELSGFTASNLKYLDVETRKSNGISINYVTDTFVNYIKTVAVINDSLTLFVNKDTVFTPAFQSRVIQVKSYLYTPGFLLSGSHPIDTLCSSKINITDNSTALNIVVHPKDFARVQFTDTLTIKNKNTLFSKNKITLRKK